MVDLPTTKANDLIENNPDLRATIEKETPVKTWLVDYVGEKSSSEDGEVTVGMIVEVLAEEFPEFLMVLAEENWVRGYQQGIHDVEVGRQMAESQLENLEQADDDES